MTNSTVTTVDSGARKVTRRVVVQAPAATVFALVADPHRHPELDGFGRVIASGERVDQPSGQRVPCPDAIDDSNLVPSR